MKRLLNIILYVVLAASASAQVKVTGRVMALSPSSGGAGGGLKPVSDVIVKLMSVTKTLAFTSSNAKGEYSLELKSALSGEVTLQFFANKATRGRAQHRGAGSAGRQVQPGDEEHPGGLCDAGGDSAPLELVRLARPRTTTADGWSATCRATRCR